MGGGASIAYCATSEDFPPPRKACAGRDHAANFTRRSSGDPFFVDTDGYLEMDDLAFGDLAAELNPDASWLRG
jgi:hypothetical protein